MKTEIKNRLLSGKALGNTGKGLKEICSDLLHTMDKGDIKRLEAETYLSKVTLLRMLKLDPAKSGSEYRPMADTCERILRVAGVELNINIVRIRKDHLPKPKEAKS